MRADITLCSYPAEIDWTTGSTYNSETNIGINSILVLVFWIIVTFLMQKNSKTHAAITIHHPIMLQNRHLLVSEHISVLLMAMSFHRHSHNWPQSVSAARRKTCLHSSWYNMSFTDCFLQLGWIQWHCSSLWYRPFCYWAQNLVSRVPNVPQVERSIFIVTQMHSTSKSRFYFFLVSALSINSIKQHTYYISLFPAEDKYDIHKN